MTLFASFGTAAAKPPRESIVATVADGPAPCTPAWSGAGLEAVPALAAQLRNLEAVLAATLTLQPETAALVTLQAALSSVSLDGWQMHEAAALRSGVSLDQLDQLCTGAPLIASEEAVAAVEIATGLEVANLSGASKSAAAAHLGKARLAEVIMLASFRRLQFSLAAADRQPLNTLS